MQRSRTAVRHSLRARHRKVSRPIFVLSPQSSVLSRKTDPFPFCSVNIAARGCSYEEIGPRQVCAFKLMARSSERSQEWPCHKQGRFGNRPLRLPGEGGLSGSQASFESSQDGGSWGVSEGRRKCFAEFLHFGRKLRRACGKRMATSDRPLLKPVRAVFTNVSIRRAVGEVV